MINNWEEGRRPATQAQIVLLANMLETLLNPEEA